MTNQNTIEKTERNPLTSGIWAGLIAGIVFGMFMMLIVAPVLGKPISAPLNMIGAVFFGKAFLMHPAAKSIVLGLIVHMMDSAVIGIIFVYIWRAIRGSKGAEIIAGMIYGIIVWAAMTYILLPIVGSPMAKVTGVWFVIGHLVFGTMLGLIAPKYARK